MASETRLIEIANDIVKIACGRKLWPDNWSSVTSAKLAKRMVSLVAGLYRSRGRSDCEHVVLNCDMDNKVRCDEFVLTFPALQMSLTFFCSDSRLHCLTIEFVSYPCAQVPRSPAFYIDCDAPEVINHFAQNSIPDHLLSLYMLVPSSKKGKFIEIIKYCCELTGDEHLKEGYERIIKFGDIGS